MKYIIPAIVVVLVILNIVDGALASPGPLGYIEVILLATLLILAFKMRIADKKK
ncbi:MAG: hypothetical protein PWQ12_1536 [Clostridiales bacterium]|jgi:hypothetical protein|nr:hypothetical protein [Clostridiales bacterium]